MATDTMEPVENAPARKQRKARWSIETTMHEAMLTQMASVIADTKSSHAAVCKASAVLLRAEAQNQRDEHRRKKKPMKTKAPVLHLRWNGKEVPESEIEGKIAEFKRQWKETRRQEREQAIADGRLRKRVRRWNVKPEYRTAMIVRWAMILADAEASPTARFAVAALMLRAEAQNQKDEEHGKKNKHRSPQPTIVGYTRDFYGNNAHELAEARAAAEAKAHSGVAGRQDDRDVQQEAMHDADGIGRPGAPMKGATLRGATLQRPVEDATGMGGPSPAAAVSHPMNSGAKGDPRPEVKRDHLAAARGAARQRAVENSAEEKEPPIGAVLSVTRLDVKNWQATGPPWRRG